MTGVFLLTSLSSQQRTKCKARHDAMLTNNSRSCGVKNSFWIFALAGDLCAGDQWFFPLARDFLDSTVQRMVLPCDTMVRCTPWSVTPWYDSHHGVWLCGTRHTVESDTVVKFTQWSLTLWYDTHRGVWHRGTIYTVESDTVVRYCGNDSTQ